MVSTLSEVIAKRQTEWDQLQLISYDDVELEVNEVCNNTFLRDLGIGEVKIREETSHSHTEIWGLRVSISMKFDLKRYYEACAQKCGHIY